MLGIGSKKWRILGLSCATCLAIISFRMPAWADSVEYTSVIVVVKDAETSQPVSQAHLTLQFREPGKKLKPKLPKHLSQYAKTNNQGRYRFQGIPKGPIHLIVTSEKHQSFGKDFEVEQDNQVLEVILKKPQPLL